MNKKGLDLIKIIKSNTFIVFVPIFIFAMAYINKIFVYEYYNLPITLIRISIEDLYSVGLLIAIFSFLIFFIYAGIFLTIEMYIIQNLPKHMRKKGYEILIGLYLFIIPISMYGIFEFLTTNSIRDTIAYAKMIGLFVLILFVFGLIVLLYKKFFKVQKGSEQDISEQQDFIFNNLLDKFKVRTLLYFSILLILATSINYASTKFIIQNSDHFFTTSIEDNKYILIDENSNNLIMKRINDSKLLDDIKLLPINDSMTLTYEKVIFDLKEE